MEAFSATGRERRKYHRLATDQMISFAEVNADDRLGVSKNLSTGGISFEAVGCEITLGDVLRVTFNIGDYTVVAVDAKGTNPARLRAGRCHATIAR